MTAPLSIDAEDPFVARGEAHDQPPGHAEQPPADDVVFAKAAVPVFGAITLRRPCSFASMKSSTCGSFWSLEPDSAKACRAACSPANRTRSMLSAASCAAPAEAGSALLIGTAVDLR